MPGQLGCHHTAPAGQAAREVRETLEGGVWCWPVCETSSSGHAGSARTSRYAQYVWLLMSDALSAHCAMTDIVLRNGDRQAGQ